jgi:hypothetical protein
MVAVGPTTGSSWIAALIFTHFLLRIAHLKKYCYKLLLNYLFALARIYICGCFFSFVERKNLLADMDELRNLLLY